MLPYYVAVSAVYGGITSASNSIIPAVTLHASGDIWSLTRLWLTGLPEWQLGSTSRMTDTHPAFGLLLPLTALVVLSIATRLVGRRTAALRIAQSHNQSPDHQITRFQKLR